MEEKRHLLIVEDEEAIRNGLVDVFVYHGYAVTAVADGVEGLAQAQSGRFDLILLDVMLPSMNGFDICDAIRQQDREQAIILLTAKVADEDIINGLKLGADDYVGKPFGVQELVLRVEAVLRRVSSDGVTTPRLVIDPNSEIDTLNMSGQIDGQEVMFTRREIQILQHLHRHHERPVAREELLSAVWGYRKDMTIETRTVDIHMAKLRRKIEPNPKTPIRLVTVRGAGYRLIVA